MCSKNCFNTLFLDFVFKKKSQPFGKKGQLGDFNGKVLTNVNFKNLTEQLGFRGRLEHYDAYMEDVIIRQPEDGTEVVEFREGPTKIRSAGLTIRRRETTSHVQHRWWKKRSSAAIQALVVRGTRRNEEHRATLSKHHKSS